MQATLPAWRSVGRACAEVAWVVVRAAQGRGYASEAARSLVAVLQVRGWTVVAWIHPGHLASQRATGLPGCPLPPVVRDGETRWASRVAGPDARSRTASTC